MKMSDEIETMGELHEYLDDAIRKWRDLKENPTEAIPAEIAACYVDAFQSVRASVFGSTLGIDE